MEENDLNRLHAELLFAAMAVLSLRRVGGEKYAQALGEWRRLRALVDGASVVDGAVTHEGGK